MTERSAASWSLDAMGLAVFAMIEPFLGAVVMLGLDDTLARKRGLRMFESRPTGHDASRCKLPGNCDLTSRLLLAANRRAGAAMQSNGLPHWPCCSFRSSFSGSPEKAIVFGSRQLIAGIPVRPTRPSVTCSVRCDGQACDNTLWRWLRAVGVPESWPDYSNTRLPWRRDDDELRPSRACFLAESGWSWEGVPMP